MASLDAVFSAYESRVAELEARAATNPFARGIAWVDGEFVPLHQARVPLLDQGFLHCDLTYDAPAVWDGRFFRLDDHISRLEASCAKLRLRLPIPREDMKRLLVEMISRSEMRDALAQMMVTRGIIDTRQMTSDKAVNNLYMFAKPYVWAMRRDVQQTTGGSAVVARTVRRVPPGAMDPTVKNLQWGDLVRGMFEAQDRGATYALLTDGDGNLTEGPGFNVVLVDGGVIYTPDRGCLMGVTRDSVLRVAKGLGLEMRCEFVPVDMAYRCDELFICTTAGGVMPITTLDGQAVAGGEIGPVTKSIMDEYWAMHYDDTHTLEVKY
ncbi:cAMP-dependent protein kinase regulatory subunit [Purpureocillium lavendulum]|uniref:cAMP-dependent protein kinase regulatory subunit n=1 Tax=Purpureocillium lavendulum TaxID=1247861 RepID=A0AB34FXN5_9HYPO|nr:cAMP-dependent protein kinase regulatory subunit [Purpureocillium lavendulum]